MNTKLTLDDLNSEDFTFKFSDLFEFKNILGQGAFGIVVSAIDKSNNQECAVKVIPKHRISSKNYNLFKKEAQILASLNHPNIVRFKDIKETDKRLFLVMELVHGGNLKSLIEERIKTDKGFTELEASLIMKQIFSAVSYMHKMGVIHRDLKPENILIEDRNDLRSIKIADFGLSAQYSAENGRSYSQKCGTMIYMAPELAFQNAYSKPVDVWTCGILLYILCAKGKHPLYKNSDSTATFLAKLKNPKWRYDSDFPKLAINIFERLVNQEPYARYTAEEACNHPWITRKIEDDVPLTANEMWLYFDLEQNFSKITKALMFILYLKGYNSQSNIPQNYKEKIYNIDKIAAKSRMQKPKKAKSILLEQEYLDSIFDFTNSQNNNNSNSNNNNNIKENNSSGSTTATISTSLSNPLEQDSTTIQQPNNPKISSNQQDNEPKIDIESPKRKDLKIPLNGKFNDNSTFDQRFQDDYFSLNSSDVSPPEGRTAEYSYQRSPYSSEFTPDKLSGCTTQNNPMTRFYISKQYKLRSYIPIKPKQSFNKSNNNHINETFDQSSFLARTRCSSVTPVDKQRLRSNSYVYKVNAAKTGCINKSIDSHNTSFNLNYIDDKSLSPMISIYHPEIRKNKPDEIRQSKKVREKGAYANYTQSALQKVNPLSNAQKRDILAIITNPPPMNKISLSFTIKHQFIQFQLDYYDDEYYALCNHSLSCNPCHIICIYSAYQRTYKNLMI